MCNANCCFNLRWLGLLSSILQTYLYTLPYTEAVYYGVCTHTCITCSKCPQTTFCVHGVVVYMYMCRWLLCNPTHAIQFLSCTGSRAHVYTRDSCTHSPRLASCVVCFLYLSACVQSMVQYNYSSSLATNCIYVHHTFLRLRNV